MATPRVKDIAERFQHASTAVRVPYLDRLRYWIAYILLARRGVMVHSPTHDAVYEDGFLKRAYDKACERINRRLAALPTPSEDLEVPIFEHGELDEADFRLLMGMRIPFVIRDGARDLPAKDWTLDSLDEAVGSCMVPINEARDHPLDDTSRPTKGHHYYDFRRGRLDEVTAAIRQGSHIRIVAAEDVMHHDDGRLRGDVDIPYWERVSGWEANQQHWLRSKMYVGKVTSAQLIVQPENAFTLLHAEPGDNFFILAKGVKTWTLAHPHYTAAMRPRVKKTTNYAGSNIDVREPDEVLRERGYEAFVNIPKVRLTLQPGDVLRVPNHWWHTAVTHPGHYAVAATLRAESGPNLLAPGYMILRRFDAQYDAMLKASMTEGRIADIHIGYPRNSRSAGKTSD